MQQEARQTDMNKLRRSQNGVANLCDSCRGAMFDYDCLRDNALITSICEQVRPATGEYLLYEPEFKLRDTWPGLPTLGGSCSRGCDFCSFLRDILLSKYTIRGFNNLHRTDPAPLTLDLMTLDAVDTVIELGYYGTHTRGKPRECRLSSLYVWLTFNGLPLTIRCPIGTLPGTQSTPAKWLQHNPLPSQSYSDEASVRWLKAVLTDCNAHKHTPAAEGFVPKRLIDVSGETPRLVSGSGLKTPKYAALSYCWGPNGSETQLKTEKDSILERESGIMPDDMTAVLRDAFYITKLLAIDYLWVDSLCILQDGNGVDWQEQCPQMHKIYGNAYVTLVAAASTHCNEEFLGHESPCIQLPVQSKLRSSSRRTLCIRYGSPVTMFESGVFHADVSWMSGPAQRGWAFQEALLSNRRIVFGVGDLHFLCPNIYQSRSEEVRHNESYDGYPISDHTLPENSIDLYTEWNETVMNGYTQFTKNSFTNPTDILPALSGVARLFQQRIPDNDEYLAGHWKNNLFRSLIWFRRPDLNGVGWIRTPDGSLDFKRLNSKDQYLVPSWSRVSRGYTEDLLNWSSISIQQEFELINAHMELAGADHFGAITGGEITLRSRSLSLDDAQYTLELKRAGTGMLTISVYGQHLCWILLDFSCRLRDDEEDVRVAKLVLVCSEQSQKSPHRRDAYGLVLLPSAIPGKHFRIGVFAEVSVGKFRRLSKEENITII